MNNTEQRMADTLVFVKRISALRAALTTIANAKSAAVLTGGGGGVYIAAGLADLAQRALNEDEKEHKEHS